VARLKHREEKGPESDGARRRAELVCLGEDPPHLVGHRLLRKALLSQATLVDVRDDTTQLDLTPVTSGRQGHSDTYEDKKKRGGGGGALVA